MSLYSSCTTRPLHENVAYGRVAADLQDTLARGIETERELLIVVAIVGHLAFGIRHYQGTRNKEHC